MRENAREGSTTMLSKYIRAGMTRNEAYKEAKNGLRESCPPGDTQHTWDLLSMLKIALSEARLMNGVS